MDAAYATYLQVERRLVRSDERAVTMLLGATLIAAAAMAAMLLTV